MQDPIQKKALALVTSVMLASRRQLAHLPALLSALQACSQTQAWHHVVLVPREPILVLDPSPASNVASLTGRSQTRPSAPSVPKACFLLLVQNRQPVVCPAVLLEHFQIHQLHLARFVPLARYLLPVGKQGALPVFRDPTRPLLALRLALPVVKTSIQTCLVVLARRFVSPALQGSIHLEALDHALLTIAQSDSTPRALLFLAEASKSGLSALSPTALPMAASPFLRIEPVKTMCTLSIPAVIDSQPRYFVICRATAVVGLCSSLWIRRDQLLQLLKIGPLRLQSQLTWNLLVCTAATLRLFHLAPQSLTRRCRRCMRLVCGDFLK